MSPAFLLTASWGIVHWSYNPLPLLTSTSRVANSTDICQSLEGEGIHFISFASSSLDLSQLKAEASQMPSFKSVRICNETCLHDTQFWTEHSDFIHKNRRGFGYWIWKYALILEALERLPECSSIVYADGGCALNINGAHRLSQYPQIAQASGGLLLFDLGLPEKAYTKRDTGERIFPHVDCERWGTQRVGGILTVINCPLVRKFFKEALQIASEEKYHYLDDSPSIKQENVEFLSHRHDQSITSLLSKKYGFHSIPDETYPQQRCLEAGYPVIAARRKIPLP